MRSVLVNPVASKTSAKRVPRAASIERSVSWPMEASPTTVPAARLMTTPVVCRRAEFVEHAIESVAAVNEVVAGAALKDFGRR